MTHISFRAAAPISCLYGERRSPRSLSSFYQIWDHFTVTREDKRQDYGEQRLVCFGLFKSEVVVMVYTERPKGPHVISLRKAEKHEARYYRQVAKENIG